MCSRSHMCLCICGNYFGRHPFKTWANTSNLRPSKCLCHCVFVWVCVCIAFMLRKISSRFHTYTYTYACTRKLIYTHIFIHSVAPTDCHSDERTGAPMCALMQAHAFTLWRFRHIIPYVAFIKNNVKIIPNETKLWRKVIAITKVRRKFYLIA